MATNNNWNNNIASSLLETGFVATAPTSGGTLGITLGQHKISLVPAGTLATYTIQLPTVTSVNNGYRVLVSTTQTITSLTILPDGSHTIAGIPTILPAGCSFELFFNSAASAWQPYSQYVLPSTLPSGLTIPVPNITGITTGSLPAVGNVGYHYANVSFSVSLVTATPTNLASFTVPAGNFKAIANCFFALSTAATSLDLGWSATSATFPPVNQLAAMNAATALFQSSSLVAPIVYFNSNGTQTYYLIGQANFSGTCTVTGQAFLEIYS